MPTLAMFDGIKIWMYWYDHSPPHFHVETAGYLAQLEIRTGRLMRGRLDAKTGRKVEAWRKRSQLELMAAWDLCQIGITPPMMK